MQVSRTSRIRRAGLRWGFALPLTLLLVISLAFVALALAVRSGPIGFDVSLQSDIRALDTGLFSLVLGLLSRLGSLPIWDGAVVLIAVALWLWSRRSAAALLVAGLSVEAATELTKVMVHRPHPPSSELSDLISSASFPSGHVARTTVILGLLVILFAWRTPRWRALAMMLVAGFMLLMGTARVASGEHWPSDVLGGYLLGSVWLGLLLLAWAWWHSAPKDTLQSGTQPYP